MLQFFCALGWHFRSAHMITLRVLGSLLCQNPGDEFAPSVEFTLPVLIWFQPNLYKRVVGTHAALVFQTCVQEVKTAGCSEEPEAKRELTLGFGLHVSQCVCVHAEEN